MSTRVRRFLVASLGLVIGGYLLWMAGFFVAHLYASRYMEWIIGRDVTMSTVEANKGLLRSRVVDRDFIATYLQAGAFPQLDLVEDETIVVYSLLGAYFTVVFSSDGETLAVVDNGI